MQTNNFCFISKTALAFTWTAEKLFKQNPHLYFWTLTFKSVPYSDEAAMEDWNILSKRLQHHVMGIQGVRVAELHRSHGIHFHLIINKRIAIRRMKRIAYGCGRLIGRDRYTDFGIMSVSKCDRNTISYLCKYLTKEYRSDNHFGGRRRWGTIGGLRPVRVRDIEVISESQRNRKRMFGALTQVSYPTMIMIQHYTNLWGHYTKWPEEHRALVWRQSTKSGGEWMKEKHNRTPF